MLKPRLQELPPRIATLKAPRAKRTGRDADPRRTIPLNSAAWQRLRAFLLQGEPVCRHCTMEDKLTPATDVDHEDGDPGNNDLTNLQPLCHEHHSRKTAKDHGKRVTYGCDERGMPADPDHPWNRTVQELLSQKSPATEPARPSGSPRATRKSKNT